jgi:hypothetical protein
MSSEVIYLHEKVKTEIIFMSEAYIYTTFNIQKYTEMRENVMKVLHTKQENSYNQSVMSGP